MSETTTAVRARAKGKRPATAAEPNKAAPKPRGAAAAAAAANTAAISARAIIPADSLAPAITDAPASPASQPQPEAGGSRGAAAPPEETRREKERARLREFKKKVEDGVYPRGGARANPEYIEDPRRRARRVSDRVMALRRGMNTIWDVSRYRTFLVKWKGVAPDGHVRDLKFIHGHGFVDQPLSRQALSFMELAVRDIETNVVPTVDSLRAKRDFHLRMANEANIDYEALAARAKAPNVVRIDPAAAPETGDQGGPSAPNSPAAPARQQQSNGTVGGRPAGGDGDDEMEYDV